MPIRVHQHRTRDRVLAALMFLLLAGCSRVNVADGPLAQDDAGPVFTDRALARRLTNTDNGLEVRKWLVADDADLIIRAFGSFEDRWATDEATTELLRLNGLRLLILTRDEVEQLRESLGKLAMDANAWFGQVQEWRPLQSRSVPGSGVTLAVDRNISRFSEGAIRLAIRCWTVPMEDGPVVQVELALQHRVARSQQDLRRLVDQRGDDEVTRISAIRLDLPLDVNHAIVLASLKPGDEGEIDAGPTSAEESPTSALLGPEVEMPSSVGSWLLDTSEPQPVRAVYVFLSRIPDRLFPVTRASNDEKEPAL